MEPMNPRDEFPKSVPQASEAPTTTKISEGYVPAISADRVCDLHVAHMPAGVLVQPLGLSPTPSGQVVVSEVAGPTNATQGQPKE